MAYNKLNFLYNESMMLGSGYMCTKGLAEAFERIGVLNYAFNTTGAEFINEEEFRKYPIFYIRGFLAGRAPYVDAGGDQFKCTLQSESFYTRHGKVDGSSVTIRDREKKFGLMITFAETDLNLYKIPTIWMPSWADITVLDDLNPPEYDKLGFIGGMPGREDWYSLDKNKIIMHKQSELARDPLVNAQRYTELINKFKILVAPPGRFFNSMTGRVFEVLACKRLCLAYRNPDTMFMHDKLFKDGVDLVYWSTFEEMEEKFRYYSKNEKEAWDIAENGYQKVRKYYNQDIMAKFIADATLNGANGHKEKIYSYSNELMGNSSNVETTRTLQSV
jgi:hypothetical protein